MPPRQNESYVIKPAAPDTSVRGLLVLPFAQTLPLSVGDLYSGCGREGDYTLIAAVRGSLTVTSHTQYFLLEAGQVLVMRCGEPYTIQSVSDCLCMEVHLQGELADRLLQERMEEGTFLFSGCAPAVRETVMALSVLEEENPPVSGELASSYAYSLLMQLCGARVQRDDASPPLSPLVESAIAIIQEEFPFLEGLDELAERLEVSQENTSPGFGSNMLNCCCGRKMCRSRMWQRRPGLPMQTILPRRSGGRPVCPPASIWKVRLDANVRGSV